ncbi:hypothetical protein V2J09_012308 [Rumex salicifolius]
MKKNMSNSGVFHVTAIFTVMCLACASASGRATSMMPVFTGDESIRIAGYGEEKLSTVIVTGTLLCSPCSVHRLQLIPISGALVAVTCNSNSHHKTGMKKPSLIKGITNKNGEFGIDMPSHLHAIADLHKACSLKVLSLPKHSPCGPAAFKARKHRRHEIVLSSVGNGVRTYSAGTLQFRPHGDALENAKRCKRESHGSS